MDKLEGKVLFYSDEKGEGIVISSQNEKYRFEVMEWEAYEVMPTKGLEVVFEVSGDKAVKITPSDHSKEQTPPLAKRPLKPRSKIIKEEPEAKDTPSKGEEAQESEKPSPGRMLKPKDEEIIKKHDDVKKDIIDYEESVKKIGENIKLSVSLSETMKHYFGRIDLSIKKREGYRKVQGRLNYLLAKRFLWTTYNNLQDIDSHIITLRIKSIADDLKRMEGIYNDFEKKTTYPSIAFEEIFLNNQREYKILHVLNQKIKEKLSSLKAEEKSVGALRKSKEEELQKISKKDKELYQTHLRDLKTINGAYADIVHMIASLKEEYKINYEKLERFSEKYRSDFYAEFNKKTKEYKEVLLDILGAQSYLLDSVLWREAKTSKAILAYFDDLDMDVELNTKGYLKFYLERLDEGKSSDRTRELFELLEYLEAEQRDSFLILVEDVFEAKELETALTKAFPKAKVKAFINEVSAFKWAMTNHVKLVILEEKINSIDAKKFLDFYHNAIFSKPNIIVIGNSIAIKSKKYTISKRLPLGVSAKKMVATINEILEED